MKILIYGAKSIALGTLRALKYLYPHHEYLGFLVTARSDNPHTLDGLKVWELQEILDIYSVEERKSLHIVIATPEDKHQEIRGLLWEKGFENYSSIDSYNESILMGRYYEVLFQKPLLKSFRVGEHKPRIQVYSVNSCMDIKLTQEYETPKWMIPIQVGAGVVEIENCKVRDDSGENISYKNSNYCELTALYWIWKNRMVSGCSDSEWDYYGLFHYRRLLDIKEEDLYRLVENDVDVILPFPTIHEPDIKEHHARYVQESDWQAMLQALQELAPEYAEAYCDIFAQEYMYNYNMLVAKRAVLEDYCAWLFPILERTEELSVPKGSKRTDRYIGYLGENLLTLYFMYNKDDLKIVHTGRIMLT